MTAAAQKPAEKYVYCPLCDYNLQGLPDGNCPECGEPFIRENLKRSSVARKESLGEVVSTLLCWPIMVWLGVIPATGIVLLPLVMLVIVIVQSEYVAIICISFALLCIFGTILFYTTSICRDLARQAHRIARAQSPDREHWSAFSLLWFFLIFELFAILFLPGSLIAWVVIASL